MACGVGGGGGGGFERKCDGVLGCDQEGGSKVRGSQATTCTREGGRARQGATTVSDRRSCP